MSVPMHMPAQSITAVKRHIVQHHLRGLLNSVASPPIMIVQGSPGGGKTTLIKGVCAAENVHLEVVPAPSLGGPYAGQSCGPVLEAMVRASRANAAYGAVLLDDFDMTEARVDENLSGTISSALLNSLIMSWADDPTRLVINDDPEKPSRIVPLERPPALFITCNNAAVLYEAAAREGRARILEHSPKGTALVAIVRAMYPSCTKAEIEELLKKYPNRSVAFYRQLGTVAVDAFSDAVIKSAQGRIGNLDLRQFAAELETLARELSLPELMKAAASLNKEKRGKNYLRAA